MKEILAKCLGDDERSFEVPTLVYDSIAEADKHAGKEGAALEVTNKYLQFHGSNALARELIVAITQELSKEPFKVVPVTKDGKPVLKDGQPVMARDVKNDSDEKYVKRVLASGKAKFDDIQKLVTARARGYKVKNEKGEEVDIAPIAVDIRAREKGPKAPAKLAQKWKDLAAQFLDGKKNLAKFNVAAGKMDIEKFVATGDREADIEALGWKCRAYQEAQDAFGSM